MPVPESVRFRGTPLPIDRTFTVALRGPSGTASPRVYRAALRLLERLGRQTGIPIPIETSLGSDRAPLLIEHFESVPGVQRAIEDESYTLEVDASGAALRLSLIHI